MSDRTATEILHAAEDAGGAEAVAALPPEILDRAAAEAEALEAKLASPPRYRVWFPDELDAQPDLDFHVEGFLPTEGVGLTIGPTGSAKTLLTLDLALTLATGGGTWFGRTARPARVLYVAAEGRLTERVRAWRRANPDRADALGENFVVVPEAVPIAEPECLADFLFDVRRRVGDEFGHTFLDTWSRVTPGLDENQRSDTSRALAAVDILRRQLGGSVTIVHHPGDDPAKANKPRGSSALLAAVDWAAVVKGRKDDDRVVSCEKARDFAPFERFSFRLRPFAPSVIIEPCDFMGTEAGLQPGEQRLIEVLEGRTQPVSATFWQTEAGIPSSSFYRYRKTLVDRDLVEQRGDGYLLPTPKSLPKTPTGAGKITPTHSHPLKGWEVGVPRKSGREAA